MNWSIFWGITLGLPGMVFAFLGLRLMLSWIEEKFGLGWSAAAALFIISGIIGAFVASFPLWRA